MEQQILCENKSFKLFILFRNLINIWGGKRGGGGGGGGYPTHGIDTNTSATIMCF